MLLIDPRIDFQIIIAASLIQLVIILCWKWTLRLFTKQKYKTSTCLYKLFDNNNYEPLSNYDFSKYHQYDLILVKYSLDSTVISETFYSKNGDIVCFKYNSKQQKYSENRISSDLFFVIFYIPCVLMILTLNLLALIQFFSGISFDFFYKIFTITQRLSNITLCSTTISIFIKPIIMDYL